MGLVSFIELLHGIKNKIPEEFLNKTFIESEVVAHGEYGDTWTEQKIEVYYYRPENETEKYIRETLDKVHSEKEYDRERQTYLRLKEKFEGKS